jgi:hypothetical protein
LSGILDIFKGGDIGIEIKSMGHSFLYFAFLFLVGLGYVPTVLLAYFCFLGIVKFHVCGRDNGFSRMQSFSVLFCDLIDL